MKRGELLDGVNLVYLIAQECGPDAVRGLNPQRGGVICDPCPGHEEQNPSFSVYRKGNRWRWKRHGGDDAGGDAYGFLLRMGYAPEAAWENLARFQGVTVPAWESSPQTPRFAPDPLQVAESVLKQCSPLTPAEMEKVARLTLPLSSVAARDLKQRGLLNWDGLELLTLASNFRTRDGKLLARAGSLVLLIRGPDGQVWGVKVRNLGSKDALEAQKMQRYVYRVAGHGAPAWCSPDYGHGDAVLIVEGELNGAAASRAFSEAGLKVDVQGLAGAGGTPFLHGLHGKPVFLYADPDPAGLACVDRVGQVARSAGAREVKVLLSESEDFCDLLGRLGVSTFAGILAHRMEAAEPWQYWQKGITGKNGLPVNNAVQHAGNDYWQTGNTYQGWGNSEPSDWGAADRGGW